MAEFFLQIDKALFTFFNVTFTNRFFDTIMPILTDMNKVWWGWVIFGGCYLLLIWKGGRKGRILGVVLLILIGVSDQLSSTFIKKIIMRPRPCHEINGQVIMEHIRLLVPCGSGYSFPSSHAVNSFAVATFLSVYYKKYYWAFFTYAIIIGYSRVYVGAHYPYDVFVGAMVGTVCALVMVYLLQLVGRYYSPLEIKISMIDGRK